MAAWRDLLLISLFGAPLLSPLLRLTAVPCTHDGHLHYHRVAALRHMWANGLYFSRWLPDLAFGYGYPFFLYREPLPLYLAGLLHAAGLPLPAASNLLYALSILAAGATAYLWVSDLLGRRAGLVAAVAYMSAPYLLVDAFIRGNLVESVALALLPLLAWSGRRFLLRGTAVPFLITTLGLAALSLSHNISLLLYTPMLLVYLLAVGLWRGVGRRALLARLSLIFVLGLGMTAFYTGPALLELDQVTISQSTTTRNNDFRFNFASLAEIFAPVPPEDPGLLNPPLPFRLGWVPGGLALLGLIGGGRLRGRERRGHVWLMGLGAAVLLFMALPVARPLWEAVPLIEFVQFPWRFVGRAALPVAFLASVPFAAHPATADGNGRPSHLARLAFLPALALLLLETLPNLYPNICSEAPFPDITAVHEYEHVTGLVGVDPEGSYFPKTVEVRPAGSPLEVDYQAGRSPRRFDTAVFPPVTTISAVAYRPTRATITLDAPVAFTARYLSFAFPGWRATVDGTAVPITPSQPEGLITFPVPAGQSTVVVRWTATPVRQALTLAGLLCLALTLAVAAGLRRRQARALPPDDDPPSAPSARLPFWPACLLAAALLGLKVGFVDRVDNPLRRPALPPVTAPSALTGAELRFEGYRLTQSVVAAGDAFDVDLAWRVMAPPAADYQSNLWLIGPDGATWSDKDTQRPRLFEDPGRTMGWPAGKRVWDSREVQVLPGTPPGRYDLVLTLFRLDTLQPLTLSGPEGQVVGPTAVIGQVTIARPDRPPLFNPRFPLAAAVDGLTLLGYDQDRSEARPGDPLLVTLFWEKGPAAGDPAATFDLALGDAAGQVVQQWTVPAVRDDYPPADWQDGERLRGQHGLRLAASLADGVYRLHLAGIRLGELVVNAPDRLWERPPATAVDALFGGPDAVAEILLAGYNLEAAESELALALVWQARRETAVSYRVFVHLVDEAGQILAQSDGEPAGWSRPTTGWAAGEYVIDRHRIAGPPGAASLSLRVGLYDPADGHRLPAGSHDYVTLPLP